MPKHRYQRREPTHDWQQIRPRLTDQAEVTYELIRPVILFAVNPTVRAILVSAVTRRQDLEAYVAVLYAAVRKHGCPDVLVSDSGSVFLDHKARQVYKALGTEKKEIEERQSWQNYKE